MTAEAVSQINKENIKKLAQALKEEQSARYLLQEEVKNLRGTLSTMQGQLTEVMRTNAILNAKLAGHGATEGFV